MRNEKLYRVHPAVDLRKYDARYFEGENQTNASKEVLMETMDKLLQAGLSELKWKYWSKAHGRSCENEGQGARSDLEIPVPVDLERES